MRLVDLHPEWMGAGGEGVSQPGSNPCGACNGAGCEICYSTGKEYVPAPRREGVGVLLDCPCGNTDENHQLYVPFANPLDGGARAETGKNSGWQRVGDTFDTLTLTPSIQRRLVNGHGCTWHGFITNGEVIGV